MATATQNRVAKDHELNQLGRLSFILQPKIPANVGFRKLNPTDQSQFYLIRLTPERSPTFLEKPGILGGRFFSRNLLKTPVDPALTLIGSLGAGTGTG